LDEKGEEIELWNMRFGAQINFDHNIEHHGDRTIGYIEYPEVDPYGDLHILGLYTNGTIVKEDEYFQGIFDSQFLRYNQILDTDNEHYLVIYECMESAYFFDRKTEKRMFGEDVWNKAIN
jgi:hypothetical protein